MNEYISAYEYQSNVNPKLEKIPIITKNILDCDYGISVIDFSNIYNVKHKATSPNLLASFIKLSPKTECVEINSSENNYMNGSSHLFYIIKGTGCIILNHENEQNQELFQLSCEDIFVSPHFNSVCIKNNGDEELCIYYVNDSPLINYLGCTTTNRIFKPSIYSKKFIHENLIKLSNPNNNRKGILLSNKDTEKIGVNTISPVLWSLYNELPPKTKQRPHKHNSVALDLCVKCSDSENVYTLIGENLDESGNIIEPIKVYWKTSEMFITPPSLWHSHHNDGDTYAYILPIQDAGILLYQRILGIVLN
jgi:gentisate 1,2-dioxygenase